ncbi:MAG TPA: response regulator [Niabella sp.]|nr:response regulator [Niabella sp.]
MKEIAVVEDDNDIREIIGFILQSDFYSVRLFADLTSFRHYLENHTPHVIVLDVMLPDGNGIEECRSLRSNDATLEIPVILMSAQQATGTKEAGAAAFIHKPFNIADFRTHVENQLA